MTCPRSRAACPKRICRSERLLDRDQSLRLTPGFNTDLVPKGTEPKTYQDLLDPKWKGKMVWSSSAGSRSGAPGFVGIVLADMGEQKGMDYLRELAKQQITGIRGIGSSSARSGDRRRIFDRAADFQPSCGDQRGQRRAGRTGFHGIRRWRDLSVISVTEGAPHPNAGKLLVDFLVSPEGQEFSAMPITSRSIPTMPPNDRRTCGPTEGNFRAIYFTPGDRSTKTIGNWAKIANEFFHIL